MSADRSEVGEQPWRVRRAVDGDEAGLRDLRIQALTDSPEQFCSTLERELARTTEDWRRWLAPGATFLLEVGGVRRGLVCAVPKDGDASAVYLASMWIHPELRGAGAADALVLALLDWAAERGLAEVWLEVLGGNDRARRFYERHGFRTTGRETPRGAQVEVEMRRTLPGSSG